MGMNATEPKTLTEAVKHFADLDVCHAHMATIKWPDGVVKCPKCGGNHVGIIATRRMFKCRNKECHKQFSVKVGTIFEDSPLGLDKWFVGIWCIVNAKNGISSCEIARALGITQKSAWHMLHRIRLALKRESFNKMTGEVESDETFVGGKTRNMHASRRARHPAGTGFVGKTVVHGLLERGTKDRASKVIAKVVANTKKKTLLPLIRNVVVPGSYLFTDTAGAYIGLSEFVHQTIDHAEKYVDGRIHTNGMENFWSLFKRTINGTYVAIDAQHLERYADEQVFRFNERKTNDAGRFALAMPGVVGKRLMYKTLIGAASEGYLSDGIAGDDARGN
jgi:transposase-like protein